MIHGHSLREENLQLATCHLQPIRPDGLARANKRRPFPSLKPEPFNLNPQILFFSILAISSFIASRMRCLAR